MRYSEIGLKILAAKECGVIKSNADFWKNYADRDQFEIEIYGNSKIIQTMEKLLNEFESAEDDMGITCIFDESFPHINTKVKNNGEKPYLLFYKGEISLLKNLNNNVAVIGLINPDQEIIRREEDIVKELVNNNLIIVSGLALGCDTISHKTSLELGGKTVAILPSTINKIIPVENKDLANEIVEKGGLLITEYYKDAISKYDAISRFIERDRLQAMFSKAIILIASYRKDEGDSGSRHAMKSAEKYEIERYVMYNENSDKENKQFGLNLDLIEDKSGNQVEILKSSSIDQIRSLENPNLIFNIEDRTDDHLVSEQIDMEEFK